MGTTPWPIALTAWSHRIPFLVQWASNAEDPRYTTIVVPKRDRLWDNLQADGDDLRVRAWDGGAAAFSNDAPDTATRTIANFNADVDDLGPSGASTDGYHVVGWIYHGNSSATNAEGAVVATKSCTNRLGGDPDPSRVVLCVPDPPGATVPAQRVSKKVGEEFDLWWDVTPALGDAPAIAGRPASRVSLAAIVMVDASTTTGTGIYSASGVTREPTFTEEAECHIAEVDGRLYVSFRVDSGVATSGTDYIAKLVLKLRSTTDAVGTQPSMFEAEYRCLLQVRNPNE